MVSAWIDEGFTTPPYGSAYYDIFEALGMDDPKDYVYDIRRPPPLDETQQPTEEDAS